MAKFNAELPNDLMKVFEDLETDVPEMMGEMCKAGARVVYNNMVAGIGKAFARRETLLKGLKITRVYKTPSDDGINVHIGFYGYGESGVPIPLIAAARESGTYRDGKVVEKKVPFMKKSFKKADIERAMLEVQEQYIKGD